VKLPFSEVAVIIDSLPYLKRALKLDGLQARETDPPRSPCAAQPHLLAPLPAARRLRRTVRHAQTPRVRMALAGCWPVSAACLLSGCELASIAGQR
jgi:hypothetical protein